MGQRKMKLFIASTLDGYIATAEHSLDWLFNVDGEGDNGFSKFYETIDTIIMGRVTYDWIMAHENEFPYKDKKCYVFSRTNKKDNDDVTFIKGYVAQFTNEIKKEDGKNIWIVGGAELLVNFIKEKLVDEIIVTIAPVLLGNGIPLFKHNDIQTLLKLKGINQYNQFVELSYDVIEN